MPTQQQHEMRTERARMRGAFLGRSHEEIGVAEFIAAL